MSASVTISGATTAVPTATPVTTPSATTPAATTTAPPQSTTTLPPSTVITSVEPTSTAFVPPAETSAPQPTTIVTQVTSVVTQEQISQGTTNAIVTTIYSTQPVVTITPTASAASTRTSDVSTSSASASQSALSAAGSGGGSDGALSSGATIAIAVIIPLVAVIAGVLFGLWFRRRRKARKNAEELRKNEMAEYGYNPNHDPTLPVGVAYADGESEGNDDSGYRGWGATSSNTRKPSTTLGSNSRAAAMGGMNALSDTGSQGGYGAQPSPSGAGSDGLSVDPLVNGQNSEGALAGVYGAATVGAAGIAGGARNRNSQVSSGIHRGPSNASSAYSGAGPPSEASSDVPEMPRPYYQEEVPYNVYNDAQPGHGPYGDGTYAQTDQPVIRDVQARRNTRIERAPTFPQQGGIAQNF